MEAGEGMSLTQEQASEGELGLKWISKGRGAAQSMCVGLGAPPFAVVQTFAYIIKYIFSTCWLFQVHGFKRGCRETCCLPQISSPNLNPKTKALIKASPRGGVPQGHPQLEPHSKRCPQRGDICCSPYQAPKCLKVPQLRLQLQVLLRGVSLGGAV